MPAKKNTSRPDPLRPAGTFTWKECTVTLLVNPKTGQAAYEIDGKRVEDPVIQDELTEHFVAINHHH